MDIPEFNEILKELKEIKDIASSEKNKNDFDALFPSLWYNDEECWKKKGGMSLSTYRCKRYLQCKGGIPDARVGGRKVWSRESVMEWVKIPDSELPAYHAKYKTGATNK